MIDFLEGRLVLKSPTRVVIECGGVGYEVLVPLTTHAALPPPDTAARLLTVFHVREDAHVLYGFLAEHDRVVFRTLTGVSGVGPKTALAALSCLSAHDLAAAIDRQDVGVIQGVPGIGRKLAARIVTELVGRLLHGEAVLATDAGRLPSPPPAIRDAELALVALGYKPAAAGRAVADAVRADPAIRDDVDALLRAAITR
jgi:Holliday junction DNA helicase RuvA